MLYNKTKEQFLCDNGFDFDQFKLENEYSAKNLLIAMDEYSEYNCNQLSELYNKPLSVLKPLEDLYRKEFPHPDGKFYIPDATQFHKWIVDKITNQNNNLKDIHQRNIAVISLNCQDFKEWRINNNLYVDNFSLKMFKANNCNYRCISSLCNVYGMQFDEIIETSDARKNKEYDEIKSLIKICLK